MARKKNGSLNFFTTCFIWHLISEPECKVEFNFYIFQGRHCRFDDMCLNILHYFTLGQNDVSFARMILLGMHFLLILSNKPDLSQIYQRAPALTITLLHAVFPIFVKGMTSSLRTLKCFSYRRLPKLASYSDSVRCMLWFSSKAVKSCFLKNDVMMAHKMHVVSRKILIMKSKDRKCYICLKSDINPPYIV